jgi:hypothetical protein
MVPKITDPVNACVFFVTCAPDRVTLLKSMH